MSEGRGEGWPEALFAAPILRALDPAGRRAVEAAGRLRRFEAGASVFEVGDLGDGFFVVSEGEVEVWAPGRGTGTGNELGGSELLRVARLGETFGEQAALRGAGIRSSAARARTEVVSAEIPAALFRRALGRSGGDVDRSPAQRLLRRAATTDLLRQVGLTRDLPEADFGLVLDAAVQHSFERGDSVYEVGDPARALWLIADGLIQLQTAPEGGEIQIQAYLRAGDFFGDGELFAGAPRSLSAVAMGMCQLVRVEAEAVRGLADRNPHLLERSRRIRSERAAHQAAVVEAAPKTTKHVFADLYRMQMARSLLTIDQDACVRCGHCAWACEQVHGVARLVRRGDKVVTRLQGSEHPGAARELLLPNSCQHCKNPSCMIDCPTGAIGRDPGGEVFIRESLCTGCGACAKACPWENIRMAPRRLPAGAPVAQQFAPSLREAAERRALSLVDMFPEVATKCDLCREYEAPACVQSCPTEAIVRLEPERDFAEVAALLGVGELGGQDSNRGADPGVTLRRGAARIAPMIVGGVAIGAAVTGAGMRGFGGWSAAAGPGWIAGLLAAATMVALAGHALPKRAVKLWMRPKSRRRPGPGLDQARPGALPRSRVRPWYRLHLALGMILPALILAHAGPGRAWSGPLDLAGIVVWLAWLSVCLGAFGGLSQALLPRVLTRLERRGSLPEDLVDEREKLLDRLQRGLSGRSPALKEWVAVRLLPWTRAPLGWVWLAASGRGLSAQRDLLRAECEAWLTTEKGISSAQPQARAQALEGLDAVLDTCVEMRALPARRLSTALLRGWLGPHALLTGALLVALAAHVVSVGTSWGGG